MIVHDLNLIGVSLVPNEAETPLVVDPYAVLPFSITVQRFQSVSRRCRHVSQFCGTIQLPKLPPGDMLDRLKAAARLPMMKSPSFRATERPDHHRMLLRMAFNVKR
jgi:hypothetical protein